MSLDSDTQPPIRIVVADDDPGFLAAMTEAIESVPTLQLLGSAASVAAAIDQIERLRPDVAIVDLRMPGGGGVAIAQAIRRAESRTAVLALSAHGDEHSISRMKRAGAQHYLVKGASVEELLEAIAVVAMSTPPPPPGLVR